MFVAKCNNGSATSTVVDDTEVVVPDTVRLPAIVTLFGKPTVIVPEDSATSISLAVPEKVTVPPRAVAVEFVPSVTVILELASLALAIEPAK